MEMTISLDEAVHSSKRPWFEWAHGEWIAVPGLGAPELAEGYKRFQRSMHSWGHRHDFTANLVRVGPNAKFRLRWRRPTTAGAYLLWSTSPMRWLDAGEGKTLAPSEYYRAGVFDTQAARRVCARATSGPWTQFRRTLIGDDGSQVVITGKEPPVLPIPAIDLPELVTEQDMFAATTRAGQRVLWALEETELPSDPAISAIAVTAGRPLVAGEAAEAVRAARQTAAASGQ